MSVQPHATIPTGDGSELEAPERSAAASLTACGRKPRRVDSDPTSRAVQPDVPSGDRFGRIPVQAHDPERDEPFAGLRPDLGSMGGGSATPLSAGPEGLKPAGLAFAAADGGVSRPLRSRAERLTLLYALFALLSIGMNLGAQQVAVTALAGHARGVLPLSVLCGTAVGFASKYMLDKRFIFFDTSADSRDEARKVVLYAFFSLFTTALFWGVEGASLRLFGTTTAKYAGGAVGLVLGYALKFVLDRRFTFTGPGRRRCIDADR